MNLEYVVKRRIEHKSDGKISIFNNGIQKELRIHYTQIP